MRRIGGSIILALAVLAAPGAAVGQSGSKVRRIGYLSPFSDEAEPIRPAYQAFHEGLRDLGWIPQKTVTIEYRWAGERYDRLPELARELVRINVDVIYVSTVLAAIPAKRATDTIPIVVAGLGDPVSVGLVASLARPGGNVTGLAGLALELSGKRLELLKEVVPGLSRVAVLSNPSHPMAAPLMRETQAAAGTLGIQLKVLEVREAESVDAAFVAMDRERVGALLVLQDPLFNSRREHILSLVARRRLPAIYVETGWAPAGGLMTYAPSLPDLHRRAAAYVDKILKGTKPADLPVEQPTKFELVVNLKTAKALGVTIPPSVLALADQVIDR